MCKSKSESEDSGAEKSAPNASSDLNTSVTGRSLWDVVDSASTNWRRFLGLSALAFVVVALVLVILLLSGYAFRDSGLEMELLGEGGFVIKAGNSETMSFLLSASSPWANTGYQIVAGDSLTIRASGRVCMAVHRLIEHAQKDTRPEHAWVGPSGMTDEMRVLRKMRDTCRQRYLIEPDLPYGALLGGISTDGTVQEPDTVFLVKDSFDGIAPGSGYLWFAVNDVILNPRNVRAAYDTCGTLDPQDTLARTANDIQSERYWDIWYDDNIGSYLVRVQTSRKRESLISWLY